MNQPPVTLAVTAGDPAGIGPEVMSAALSAWQLDPLAPRCRILTAGTFTPISPGQPSPETARTAWDALEEAASLALTGQAQAVVTGPVCKRSLRAIGFPFPGQTEFFAARAGTPHFCMAFAGGPFLVALATTHVPLRSVPSLLTPDLIISTGRLLLTLTRTLTAKSQPRIAVAGLNPHAGENGEFGREELDIILPAIAALREETRCPFSGPCPPDTVFWQAHHGEFDAVLCMYHDQALIPLKTLAFEDCANITLGLPFIRTSPDHGTAFSLAGTGTASHRSALQALRLAAHLALARTHPSTLSPPPSALPVATQTAIIPSHPPPATPTPAHPACP